jgi:hypothetical protein
LLPQDVTTVIVVVEPDVHPAPMYALTPTVTPEAIAGFAVGALYVVEL